MSYEFGNTKVINGVVWGVVSDNKHPDGSFEVRCKLPWILSKDAGDDADFVTGWAKVMSPTAGGGRGFYCLPEIGDEVVLAFVHGSISVPVVLGSVWSGATKAPHGGQAPLDITDPAGNDLGIKAAAKDTKDGKNNARFFISRSGSTMLFDDTRGKEKISFFTPTGACVSINDEKQTIAIQDKTKDNYLLLDTKNKKLTLETKTGDIHILCKKGLLNIEAKNIKSATTENQEHKAKGTWKQESKGQMDLKADADIKQKGAKIHLN